MLAKFYEDAIRSGREGFRRSNIDLDARDVTYYRGLPMDGEWGLLCRGAGVETGLRTCDSDAAWRRFANQGLATLRRAIKHGYPTLGRMSHVNWLNLFVVRDDDVIEPRLIYICMGVCCNKQCISHREASQELEHLLRSYPQAYTQAWSSHVGSDFRFGLWWE